MDCICDLLPSLDLLLAPDSWRIGPLGALLGDKGPFGQDEGASAFRTLHVVFKNDVIRDICRNVTVTRERSHDVPVPQRQVAELQRLGDVGHLRLGHRAEWCGSAFVWVVG